MKKNLITILCFLILISFVFGEFELMKRSRGYTEAVDYLTIKIKQTTCDEFLKKGGLAEKIRGGYSHHCLPIDSKGKDTDDFKFVGRCLNSDKDIILSIFEVKNKRAVQHKSDDNNKHRSFLNVRNNDYGDEDVEFYITLKSGDKPLEFKIKNFNLKNGHAYQVRRPKCIKAKNYCFKKDAKEEMMVIDCISKKELEGKVDKDSRVYIEITRRETRPDTCSDRKNGYCCRYVNASPKGGICKLYKRKSTSYAKEGDNKKDEDKSQNGKEESKNKSVEDEEEESLPVKGTESLDNLLKDIGINPEEVVKQSKDTKKEPTSNTPSTEENEQPNTGKENEEGEEFDSANEEVEKKSVPVNTPSNEIKKDVSTPVTTPEKRQVEEEEDPEFDMFEDEDVEKKNIVEQPKPHSTNFAKNEGPNSFVIPNLKKKKNEHKVTAKNVVEPQPQLIQLVKPVEVIKPVELVKPLDLVQPIVSKQETPIVPKQETPKQETPKQETPIVPISEQSQPEKK